MPSIDLNGDVGELPGGAADAALIPLLTSASIACGGHAGDEALMRQALRLTRTAGVAAGAHPGFADPNGFGRRERHVSAWEVEDLVVSQVAALAGLARDEGIALRHVKPHGALYHLAAREPGIAEAVARAVRGLDGQLALFAPPASALLHAGAAAGLAVAAEGFPDRSYEPDGTLTPRGRPGAVLLDPVDVAARAVRMARDGVVAAADGSDIPLPVDTLCVHGDTPEAAILAAAIRRALEAAGLMLTAFNSAPPR